MEQHHKEAIEQFMKLYKQNSYVIAILLTGSLAHGYAKPDSDIDIILVVDNTEYERRKRENQLAFSLWDICNYEGGYIDCKITNIELLHEVAAKGSDASRYAFKDAQVLTSNNNEIYSVLNEIYRFPQEKKAERQFRFVCQLLAWKWYMSQAEHKKNKYLLYLSAQKIILFASRTVLNENEMLFPYHKWLLEELKKAEKKPDKFEDLLWSFSENPSFASAQLLVDTLLGYIGIEENKIDWPNQFMIDSEMNWLYHEPPVDDL